MKELPEWWLCWSSDGRVCRILFALPESWPTAACEYRLGDRDNRRAVSFVATARRMPELAEGEPADVVARKLVAAGVGGVTLVLLLDQMEREGAREAA